LRPAARWHLVIWQALRDTVGDYFGRVDLARAARLIDQLDDLPDLDVESGWDGATPSATAWTDNLLGDPARRRARQAGSSPSVRR
jgi:hypothetical protein